MVGWIVRIVIAVGVAFVVYVVCTASIRMFKTMPPEETPPAALRDVDYRYRCSVCGAEVTMTGAPGDEIPEPPRHCREDMDLVAGGD